MGLFRQELTWRTSLTPEQVRDALAADVKPARLMGWDVPGRADPRPYRGEVGASSFRFIRRIQYRNSFTPVVEGKVTAVPGGSQVELALYVHGGVMAFVGAWTVIAGVATLWLLGQTQPATWNAEHFSLLLPLLAPVCAWLLYNVERPNSLAFVQSKLPPLPPT